MIAFKLENNFYQMYFHVNVLFFIFKLHTQYNDIRNTELLCFFSYNL